MIGRSPRRPAPAGLRLAAGLLGVCVFASSSRADSGGPPERLTAEQRRKLEQEADELEKAVLDLYQSGDHRPALEKAGQGLRIRERLYPRSEHPLGHPDLAGALRDLGILHRAVQDPVEARAYLRRALAMYEVLYPRERYPRGHAGLAKTLTSLGTVAMDQEAELC